ncbi:MULTISPECIES: flagellar hook-associated protein FlgK [unclassified Sedimentibacter]|uniref:flagellar hook-associated protein FlgK n=1 Tax=unclassified Sedimentibacter TaxID=2649220 RepID=UPI0027E212BC|nr:flagellar hook-associated protein FlgK [Sedimentibacter sp. MB35-C1]WMJ78587.1 flagellar hook-associated protein FlgK [Sedimentibacter sp. MB35-C1]
MLRSTFLGYKVATSALTVNQNMIDIVGQNLSNIKTKGYTRQRLDITSFSLSTSNIKFGTNGVVIGQGVQAIGVSQYRDSFLDLRYRLQAAKAGSEDVQLEALSDLEEVFDEIKTDGLDAQFSDLLEQLQSLTSSPSDPVLEGVVRSSAQMLTQMFNNYSEQIDTITNQQTNYLQDGAIVKINQLTENIVKLNEQIKADNISGNPALELNDERNMLIDELSNYLDIEVDYVPLDIGGGKTIDEMVIRLRGTSEEIVNRNESYEIKAEANANNEILIYKKDSSGTENDITSSINGGQLDGYLKFLNGKGSFSTSADTYQNSDVNGIQYYKNMLDMLANKFAENMNALNETTDGPNDLFASRGGGDITAGNIKISDDWLNSSGSYIVNTTSTSEGDNAGATDNILRMINSFQTDEDYVPNVDINDDGTIDEGDSIFNGTFQEFLSFTTTRLNLQLKDVKTSYETYFDSQYQLDFARSSISSVDLNEEGVNLLQYSKSYNAAARLMTTLDDMLDTLINRMGV